MGATNNIKTLFYSSDILARTCSQCDGYFTEADWKSDNWDLEYRDNNSGDFSDFKEGKSRGYVSVEIELYHEDCPKKKNE